MKEILIDYDKSLNKERREFARQFCRWLVNEKGMKKGSLVDIGAGDCIYTDSFNELGFNVAPVDLVKTRDDVIVGDAEKKIPLTRNSADYIFCRHTIEHFDNATKFFEESKRVLKKSGKLIIITPSWKHSMKSFYDGFTHRKPYTVGSLRNGIVLNGMKIEEVSLFRNLPFFWKHTLSAFNYLFPLFGVQVLAIASNETQKKQCYRSYPYRMREMIFGVKR